MADGREKFLKYVLERSKEINRGDDCCTSIYLARLQFLHEIGNISTLDYQDEMERSRKCLF